MMDEENMPMFTEPISDEAAHALSEMLSWLSITFDNTYYGRGKLGPSGKTSIPIKDIWLYPINTAYKHELTLIES